MKSVVIVVLYIFPGFFRIWLYFQVLRLFDRFFITSAERLPILLSLQATFLCLVLVSKSWLDCLFGVELNGLRCLSSWHWRLPCALFVPAWLIVCVQSVDGVVPLLIAGAFLAAGALLISLLVLVAVDLHLLLSNQITT